MDKLAYYVNKDTQDFFDNIQQDGVDLTFDDVLLKPRYSNVLPKQTQVNGFFSRNIPLKSAIVSAAMDTVTDANLAIAIAMEGGMGVIHKNLLPEDQAKEVRKVKHKLHGKIESPITFTQDITLAKVKEILAEKGYDFNTFPILDDDEKLIGLITHKNFKFCMDDSILLKDLMIKDVFKAPMEITLEEAYKLMIKNENGVLPLVDKDGYFKGIYIFSDVERIVNGGRSNYTVDKKGRLRVAAAIGVIKTDLKDDSEWERIDLLVGAGVDALVLDSAHGHSEGIINTLKKIKKKYPKVDVVAGNVSTPEAVEILIKAGADGIKVGQGPGSICTTRIVTGSGSAQLSAIFDCVRASKGKVPIIADGGIRYSGDLVKAFATGASCVMVGSLFASCMEAPGDTIKIKGVSYKIYRGMGSMGAMKSWVGSRERYGQSNANLDKMVAEGIEGKVLVKGPLSFVFGQLIGGVQSGMGNSGATDTVDLQKKAKFRRISPAGLTESHPHDLAYAEDAPNYRKR